MFWLIPFALKAAAVIFGTGITLAAIDDLILSINAKISRPTVKEVMSVKGLDDILIKTVNRTSNKITFEDLNSRDVWELSGTDIDYDIQKGVRIYDMTDEERFFYELGRKSYYGGMYSLIKAVENRTNKITLDELCGECETPGEANKKKGD